MRCFWQFILRAWYKEINVSNIRKWIALLSCSLLATACGRQDEAPNSVNSQPAPAATSAPAMPRSSAPAGASLYFVGLQDGDTVQSPLRVEFGLDGMDVVPAGTQAEASGHHHIIIDADLPPMDMPIPADEHHVHFGDGSTSTELTLAPGTHTLQLLLGDHLHIPHQPPVSSDRITITVE